MTGVAVGEVTPMFAALTGVDRVPDRLASSALAGWRTRAGDASVDGALQAFAEHGLDGVRQALDPDLLRSLVHFLYLGSWPTADPADELRPEHHFEALIWRVVQAHPPALSGGYYGHWHYPPEDDAD